MRRKLVCGIILVSSICIFIPFSYANEGKGFFSEKKRAIKETLDRIELAFEIGFATQGTQIFEVVDDQERRISRLEYPHRREMGIFRGEVGFPWLSGFSIGGRYGNSLFKKREAIDQDWDPDISEGVVGWESESRCKPDVEFYDFNLYFRLLDLDEEEIVQRRLTEESSIFDYLMVDRLSLDIFAGYQHQKGHYPATDGVWTIYDYISPPPPWAPSLDGLDSFYKIRYRGPRLGMRAEGSKGKFTTRVSFAYAWLETEAYGWWNLREYSFWQSGTEGYGVDIGAEVTYAFTPSLSAGLGFNYLYCRQKKLKESGRAPDLFPPYDGSIDTYDDWDIIRNANCKIFGPSFILKYTW